MVRRVDQAVPNRMQATRNSASGCAHGTCGGTLVEVSVTWWKTHPPTRPTAAKMESPAGLMGRSRPSGSGGSGRSSGGSGSALTVTSKTGPRASLHLQRDVVETGEAAAVDLLEQVGDRADVGDLGVRLDVEPRLEH